MVFPQNDDMNVLPFGNLVPSSGNAIVGCVIESSNTTNIIPLETLRTSLNDVVPNVIDINVQTGGSYMIQVGTATPLSSILPSTSVTQVGGGGGGGGGNTQNNRTESKTTSKKSDDEKTKEDNNNKNCSKSENKTDNHNENLKRMSSDQYKTLKNRISEVIKEHDAKSTSEIKKDPKLEKAVRDEINKFVTNDLKLATQGNSGKPK